MREEHLQGDSEAVRTAGEESRSGGQCPAVDVPKNDEGPNVWGTATASRATLQVVLPGPPRLTVSLWLIAVVVATVTAGWDEMLSIGRDGGSSRAAAADA